MAQEIYKPLKGFSNIHISIITLQSRAGDMLIFRIGPETRRAHEARAIIFGPLVSSLMIVTW